MGNPVWSRHPSSEALGYLLPSLGILEFCWGLVFGQPQASK